MIPIEGIEIDPSTRSKNFVRLFLAEKLQGMDESLPWFMWEECHQRSIPQSSRDLQKATVPCHHSQRVVTSWHCVLPIITQSIPFRWLRFQHSKVGGCFGCLIMWTWGEIKKIFSTKYHEKHLCTYEVWIISPRRNHNLTIETWDSSKTCVFYNVHGEQLQDYINGSNWWRKVILRIITKLLICVYVLNWGNLSRNLREVFVAANAAWCFGRRFWSNMWHPSNSRWTVKWGYPKMDGF